MDGWPFKCWSGCCSQKYRKSPREETRGLENIFPGPLKHTHTKGKREKNLTLISKPDSEYSEIFLTCIIWYFQLKNLIIAFPLIGNFGLLLKKRSSWIFGRISDLVDNRISGNLPYYPAGLTSASLIIMPLLMLMHISRVGRNSIVKTEKWVRTKRRRRRC